MLSVVLSLALCLSLLPVTALTAAAADGVPYQWCDENGRNWETRYCETYTVVDSNTTTWYSGWYVVPAEDPITIGSRVSVSGQVHLILTDGCSLMTNEGVNVPTYGSLTIYGQSGGTGKLTAKGRWQQDDAGIGGNNYNSNGAIVINGGTIEASGNSIYGSGIGSGTNANSSNITINGGTVTATGGNWGAGIGAGSSGNGSNITINGGSVTANSGSERGAGIGGGGWGGKGSNITITGGTVTANARNSSGAAGIGSGGGGGNNGSGSGNITITGGTVTAISNNGNAISGTPILDGYIYVATTGDGYKTPFDWCGNEGDANWTSQRNVRIQSAGTVDRVWLTACPSQMVAGRSPAPVAAASGTFTGANILDELDWPDGEMPDLAQSAKDSPFTWTVGNSAAGSKVENGMLTVNPGETAETLTVTASKGGMSSEPGIVSVIKPFVIGTQPASVSVGYGYTAGPTLSVKLSGAYTDAARYQWYKNWTAIDGATSSSYTVETGLGIGDYTYYCEVKDSEGSYTLTSDYATVTVGVGIDYAAEKLTGVDTVERGLYYSTSEWNDPWSSGLWDQIDRDYWKACPADMTLESIGWTGEEMTVYFSYDSNPYNAPQMTLTVPSRPAAPASVAVTKTQTSITFTRADTEFSEDDGASWQSSGTVDGLTADTQYTAAVRTKATAEAFASYSKTVTVTTVSSDGSTTLQPGETVETEDGGSITNHGDNIILDDGSGNTTTVTPPEDEDFSDGVAVDGDGNVTIPDGSVVTPSGSELEITIDDNNDDKATVDENGSITLPGGGSAKIDGDITVTVPEKGGTLKPDGKGGVEIPNGSKVTPPGGPEIEIADGPAAMDKDGNVTFPEGGSVKVGDTTVTVPKGGTVTPNEDGTLDVPPGSIVKDKDGKESTVSSQGGKLDSKGNYTDNTKPTPSPPSTPSGSGSSTPSTYPPTVSKTGNGKVSTSPASPRHGDTVTVTPTPDEGYEVGGVVVKDRNGNVLEVKDNGDGTFSFTQPTGKVTIDVTFVPKEGGTPSPALSFSDIEPNAWYFEAVDYVIRNGLMTGYGNGKFAPGDELSRAMLAQILYNAEDKPGIDNDRSFTDTPSGAWYVDAVTWAANNGIVAGYGNGMFGPDDPITREQLAVMLYRYAQSKDGGLTDAQVPVLNFADISDVSGWAADAMAWAVSNGIIEGKGNGILDPKGQATRAEAAAMLMRFLTRQMEE